MQFKQLGDAKEKSALSLYCLSRRDTSGRREILRKTKVCLDRPETRRGSPMITMAINALNNNYIGQ